MSIHLITIRQEHHTPRGVGRMEIIPDVDRNFGHQQIE